MLAGTVPVTAVAAVGGNPRRLPRRQLAAAALVWRGWDWSRPAPHRDARPDCPPSATPVLLTTSLLVALAAVILRPRPRPLVLAALAGVAFGGVALSVRAVHVASSLWTSVRDLLTEPVVYAVLVFGATRTVLLSGAMRRAASAPSSPSCPSPRWWCRAWSRWCCCATACGPAGVWCSAPLVLAVAGLVLLHARAVDRPEQRFSRGREADGHPGRRPGVLDEGGQPAVGVDGGVRTRRAGGRDALPVDQRAGLLLGERRARGRPSWRPRSRPRKPVPPPASSAAPASSTGAASRDGERPGRGAAQRGQVAADAERRAGVAGDRADVGAGRAGRR